MLCAPCVRVTAPILSNQNWHWLIDTLLTKLVCPQILVCKELWSTCQTTCIVQLQRNNTEGTIFPRWGSGTPTVKFSFEGRQWYNHHEQTQSPFGRLHALITKIMINLFSFPMAEVVAWMYSAKHLRRPPHSSLLLKHQIKWTTRGLNTIIIDALKAPVDVGEVQSSGKKD